MFTLNQEVALIPGGLERGITTLILIILEIRDKHSLKK